MERTLKINKPIVFLALLLVVQLSSFTLGYHDTLPVGQQAVASSSFNPTIAIVIFIAIIAFFLWQVARNNNKK